MKIVVVMPAYNEAEGISEFLLEINTALHLFDVRFIVIDDCSSDGTVEAVRELAGDNLSVEIIPNEFNLGHGPSTLKALRYGLGTGAEIIVSIDGDGQFLGEDVLSVVASFSKSELDLVEGVRTFRNDPIYRQIVSLSTRLLVASRVRKMPLDANTPLRAYKAETLEFVLKRLPESISIPNLLISSLSRANGFSIHELEVRSIPRRGTNPQGSTWGNGKASLPTKRFLKFCGKAVSEWFSTSLKS
jgi:glycosyltransferase involved in cell wall biosynthesis